MFEVPEEVELFVATDEAALSLANDVAMETPPVYDNQNRSFFRGSFVFPGVIPSTVRTLSSTTKTTPGGFSARSLKLLGTPKKRNGLLLNVELK